MDFQSVLGWQFNVSFTNNRQSSAVLRYLQKNTFSPSKSHPGRLMAFPSLKPHKD